jgi:uncharacterized membrane protein YeaQ/YmgE (transglycosylase-associated protein family)
MMRGGSDGIIGDIVLGSIRTCIGGWISGLLRIGSAYGLIGRIAFVAPVF